MIYCWIIFNPRKCGVMTGWVKRRAIVKHRDREYGIVEDEADHVELSASLDVSDSKRDDVLNREQYKDTMETMI